VTTTVTVRLTVNGEQHVLRTLPHRPLLDVLRDDLFLTGAKECCAVGECGACTVIVDGLSVNSCLMLAVEADGATVTTAEGLAGPHARLSPLQTAFLHHGAVQCGFCIPGMVVSAQQLLNTNPSPTVEEIREGLSGNLCRCAGYNRIVSAVQAAAAAARPTTSVREDAASGAGVGQVDQ
jgi:aerobic-type carbon monoxide dehydrogenase small subunit (CoxS/CutS family)